MGRRRRDDRLRRHPGASSGFWPRQLTEACFLLLDSSTRGRRTWLRTAPVTTAAGDRTATDDGAADRVHQRQGLERSVLPADDHRAVLDEFIAGMAAEPSRSRRLGDVGANAPAQLGLGRTPADRAALRG